MRILSLKRLHVTANVHIREVYGEYTALWQKVRDWRDVLCRKKKRRNNYKASNVVYRS